MKQLLSGNEAIARGIWEAGIKVASAYPGTPSTEVIENLPQYRDDIYCEWAPNEKVALEVAYGAAVAGSRSVTAMKMVGLNVAADPFFTASYLGVKGGFVIVNADDPSMHSSQNEQDNRYYARAAKVPLIEPSDAQECKDFVRYACEISEKFDTPVLFRTTTRVSHSKSLVELGERTEHEFTPYARNTKKYVCTPANSYAKRPLVEKRLADLAEFGYDSPLNRVEMKGTKIGVISASVAYQYAKEVFPEDASFLKLGLTFPLPMRLIREFAEKVETLYVVEELEPFMEDQIKAAWMYMEWLTQPENLFTFQWGIEGENFNYDENKLPVSVSDYNGGLPVTVSDYNGDYKMGFSNNKDYWCITIEARQAGTIEDVISNNMPHDLPQDFTQDVINWYHDKVAVKDAGWAIANALYSVTMEAEAEYQKVLTEKYKEYRDKLTMCAPEEFDALYAQFAQEYLDAGYQEVIDERAAAYEAGNSTHMLNQTATEVDLGK